MYHLLKGLHEYLTKKDEYSVVIIGLDNAGKTTMLERIKTIYNPIPGMQPDKIGPTVGQNIGKISLPSTTLSFFDLGGQRDIRSIWEKYYDECHAVVFVLDAGDGGRLSEGWGVFDEVLTSPRLLNLPLLLIANKQDTPGSLSVSEIRESFDAWQRASAASEAIGIGLGVAAGSGYTRGETGGSSEAGPSGTQGGGDEARSPNPAINVPPNTPNPNPNATTNTSAKQKGKSQAAPSSALPTSSTPGTPTIPSTPNPNADPSPNPDTGPGTPDTTEEAKRIWSEAFAYDGGAKAERVASLDVLGASALTGEGVRELVDWLYIRVQGSRRM